MKRATILSLTLLLIFGSLFPAAASEFPPGEFILGGSNNGEPDSTRVVPVYRAKPTGNWVIHYDPNTPLDEKWEYVNRIGATIVERIDELEIWVVDVPDAFGSDDFTFDSDVELVEQDFVVSVQFDNPPNDPDYDRQWALQHIEAEKAWDQMGQLADVSVAVIDTGVCMSHEDLLGRVLDNGYDFVDNDDDPEDVFGHGCSVAGIIAANIDNGIGIAGFAPNSSILPVRVLGPGGSGPMADVAAGIVYAADEGADSSNLSLRRMCGSQVEAMETRRRLRVAVAALPETARDVTRDYYLRGDSQREIAERLNIPLATVKKRLQYARQHLRNLLTGFSESLDRSMYGEPQAPKQLQPVYISRRRPPLNREK